MSAPTIRKLILTFKVEEFTLPSSYGAGETTVTRRSDGKITVVNKGTSLIPDDISNFGNEFLSQRLTALYRDSIVKPDLKTLCAIALLT